MGKGIASREGITSREGIFRVGIFGGSGAAGQAGHEKATSERGLARCSDGG